MVSAWMSRYPSISATAGRSASQRARLSSSAFRVGFLTTVERPDLDDRAHVADRRIGNILAAVQQHVVVAQHAADLATGLGGLLLQAPHQIDDADPVGPAVGQVTEEPEL